VIAFGNGRVQVGVQITENNGGGLSCNASNPCPTGSSCVAGECLGSDGATCGLDAECASGVCGTFYQDMDGDGFGSSASPVRTCGTTAPSGQWVGNNLDCCDIDFSVNPNYSAGASSTSTACGDFDFDCDGVETSSIPVGTCASYTASTCPGVVYSAPGPACGDAGGGAACAVVDGVCQNVRGANLVRSCY
jgi:hypothetical protein